MRTKIPLLLLLLLLTLPSIAQDGGRGVVREGVVATGDVQLHPLFCDNDICYQATELLYPLLWAIDPQTGLFVAGTADNHGLAVSWETTDGGQTYDIHLRDDALWSDGEPITAYDVLYSFMAGDSNATSYQSNFRDYVDALIPVSDTQLTLILDERWFDCDTIVRINQPIIPAHIEDTEFATIAASAFNTISDAPIEQWETFAEAYRYRFSDWDYNVSTGNWSIESVNPTEFVRLTNGDLAFELVQLDSSRDELELFLAGELSYTYPDEEEWLDFATHDGVRLYEAPGDLWDTIIFNFADPNEPRGLYDEDGELEEYLPHRLFSDIRVRQAVQLALNRDALMEAALFGHGVAMPSDQMHQSWAYNDELEVVGYNPRAAERLLEDAGWRRVGSNQVRSCVACETAPIDTPLRFTLLYHDGTHYRRAAAQLIVQQLEAVGFDVSLDSSGSYDAAQGQAFDAYYMTWRETYPITPDTYSRYAMAEDIVIDGDNIGSYYNQALESILDDAAHVPTCNIEERADLYRQAQVIFQNDLPNVWLYSHNELFATRDTIRGVAPVAAAPLWNVSEWVTWDD